MNVADRLAEIRANLAALESRAETRRARDAGLAADVDQAPKAPGKSGRKKTEDEPAMACRDWLSEARADLARVDAAPRVQTRRIRPATAPEYANESAPPCSTGGHRTEPTIVVGGNADGAAAGNPEDSQWVDARTLTTSADPQLALVGQGAKSPAPIRKLPMASAGDWRERMRRIDANALRASLAPSFPLAGPFDGVAPVRGDPRPAAVAGCGPPEW